MAQFEQDKQHVDLEAELAANEAAARSSQRRLIVWLVVVAIIIGGSLGVYLALHPKHEPDIYYKDGTIDYMRQADKLRRTSGFKFVDNFRGGYAIVSDGKLYGVVDVNGKVVCPVKYDAIESNYSEHYPDLCQVRKNGKLGLVDKQGREVLPPIYDDMGPISNSTIPVTLGKEEFYVDTDGKKVE